MESFRNPKFVERYEDVVFDLQTPLNTTVANGASQIKTGYRFVADNAGEVSPFDWYNARLETDFKVVKIADGGNLAADDHNGIVNGSHSLINEITVNINGIQVYNCNYANHCVNIKNLLEYDRSYTKTATNQFYYLDTSRHAEERTAQANYNKGFAARKALLRTSDDVNTEIPLNRYSFFEALEDELLPNSKVEIKIKIESDNNLVWQAADDCRVVITKFRLWVPRIIFTGTGRKHYLNKYLKPHKWTYLKEVVDRSSSTKEQTGTYRISAAIKKPRHVFVWISNDANENDQKLNSFLYNTFSVSTNNQKLVSCYLEVGNGNRYPESTYLPSTEMSRIFRDVIQYSHANNDYKGGTLLSRTNFENLFSFLYFDLENQKMDIKDEAIKLSFHYNLSGGTNANYSVYALVLHEQDAELEQSSGKLMLRA